MKDKYRTFKEMDTRYVNKFNLELKLSYLLTDIMLSTDRGLLNKDIRSLRNLKAV